MESDVWFHMPSNTAMNNTCYPQDKNDDGGGVDDDDDDDDDNNNNNNNNNFSGRSLHTFLYLSLCFVWIYSYFLNETESTASFKLN